MSLSRLLWLVLLAPVASGQVIEEAAFLLPAGVYGAETGPVLPMFLRSDGQRSEGVLVWDVNATVPPFTASDSVRAREHSWRSTSGAPHDVYLDPARHILVVLYRVASICPAPNERGSLAFELEILVAGRPAAISVPEAPVRFPSAAKRPDDPVGYCGHYVMFPTEIDKIPAGSSVELRVRPVFTAEQELVHGGAEFGTLGSHQSYVHLPVYSWEDAVFRHPDFAGDPLAALGERPTADAAGLVLVGAGLATALGRRGWTYLAAAVALAGCLGPAERADTVASARPPLVSVSADVLDRQGTGLTGHGHGALVGFVHEPNGAPVQGADVVVFGRANSTRTSGYGVFLVTPLPAGQARLLIQAPQLALADVHVPIEPGKLTRVRIELRPLDGGREGTGRHVHDLWTSSEEHMPPVRTSFEPRAERCTVLGLGPPGGNVEGCAAPFGPPSDGRTVNTIKPGTRELIIRFEWHGAPERLGLALRSPIHGADAGYTFAMRAPGEPFRVPVSWEMADDGHRLFSRWRMHAYSTAGPFVGTPLATHVDVRMSLVRGTMPFEPAHEDRWGFNQTIPFPQQSCSSAAEPRSKILYTDWACRLQPNLGRSLPPIPPGTTWINLTLHERWMKSPFAPESTPIPPVGRLQFHPSDHPDPSNRPALLARPLGAPQQTASGLYESRWAICASHLSSEAAYDPFYERRSFWRFLVDDGRPEPFDPPERNHWSYVLWGAARRDAPPSVCD